MLCHVLLAESDCLPYTVLSAVRDSVLASKLDSDPGLCLGVDAKFMASA